MLMHIYAGPIETSIPKPAPPMPPANYSWENTNQTASCGQSSSWSPIISSV